MQILIVTNTVNDILCFAYLRNMIDNVRLSGIIVSGGHTRIKRLLVKSYLKNFDYPNWNSIPIYMTCNEFDDDYIDINNNDKQYIISLLNTSNKSIIELENDCIFPSFDNEYEFIESLNIQNGVLICIGQILGLYNAYLTNNNVLKYFDHIFVEGNIIISSQNEINNLDNNLYFATMTEYYQTETKKIYISIDYNNSYNFCGIWNKTNRKLMDKQLIDIDIINKTHNLFKIIFETTSIQLYFIGSFIGETIFITKDQLKCTNHDIITNNPNINDYYPTDALTMAYFDSVLINKNVRDSLRFIMFETTYFRIRTIGNNNRNLKSANLSNNLLLKIQKQILNDNKTKTKQDKSLWWKK